MVNSPRRAAFSIVFAVVYAIAYVIAVEWNVALFTYHPALGEFGPGVQPPRDGPAMYWYGWMATAGLTALAAGLAACLAPRAAARLWSGIAWAVPIAVMLAFVWMLRGYFLR